MLRKFMKMVLAGTLGMMVVVVAIGSTSTAAEDKTADVSTIMKKSFGKGGLKSSISTAAKDGKWDDAKKLAKEWTELSAAIGKNKAPKGDAKSWEEHSTKFTDSTKAVLKATEDKDATAVTKSVGSFNCMGCHKAHKP
jgi:hypothetical protein